MKNKAHFCIESRSILYRGKDEGAFFYWKKYEDLDSKGNYQCLIISNFILALKNSQFATKPKFMGKYGLMVNGNFIFSGGIISIYS